MRKRQPDAERPFKTPFVPLVPILGILTCVVMMVSLPLDTWIRLFVWLAIGFAIYFAYGKKNSKLRNGISAAQDSVKEETVIMKLE